MTRHILASTDFSKRSAIAIERALALAELQGASVTVVHVIDEDQPTTMIEAARREAEILIAPMSGQRGGVTIDHAIRVGDPHEAINQAAEEAGADLVVFGAHRQAGLRKAFLGTTAERAIRRSRVPALVVRNVGVGPYRKPVCALDLIHQDFNPWRGASALSIMDEAAGSILFAYESGSLDLLRKANKDIGGLENYLRAEREAVLPSVAKAMTDLGLKPEQAHLLTTYFSPAETILDFAKRTNSDLIIVGSHQKSAIDRLMLGSVSGAVLTRSEIDVLIVPPAKAATRD
ncbi:MAG: universal stress protein [Parvularculaceae bacterium]|nr:universal stress protein [Parvularculaceae bacterium]